MGDSFVDAALAKTNTFDLPLQEMVFENAWGSTWSQDTSLSLREKSLITISMLIAQKAWDELEGHIRGAVNNGASNEEIRAVIMHASIYCGFPGALSAMKIAKEILDL